MVLNKNMDKKCNMNVNIFFPPSVANLSLTVRSSVYKSGSECVEIYESEMSKY